MAEKVTVALVDDLDGSEATETVEFALDGVQYAIDLNWGHAETLREELAPYIQRGKRVGGRKKGRTTRKASTASRSAGAGAGGARAGGTQSDRERTKAIRSWAKEAGYELSDRGRIPGHIVQAYDAAH